MLDSLRSIVQQVSTAEDINQAVALIVKKVKKAMRTEVCSLYLKDQRSERFVFMATEGLNKEAIGKVSLGPKQGLVGLVASREEPINLDNAQQHKAFKLLPDIGEESFNSFLGTPIMHQGKVLGVLVVQQQQSRKFNELEESFLVTVAAQLAGLIAHAQVTGALFTEHEKTKLKHDVHYQGISGSNGLAIAKAKLIYETANLHDVPERLCDDIEQEVSVFHECVSQVRDDINVLKDSLKSQLSPQEVALFDVYLQMLDDAVLGKDIVAKIKEGFWAPYAVSSVVLNLVQKFQQMDDDYLRERASDVRDLGQRMLAYLQEEGQQKQEYNEPIILIGDELTASMLGEVPAEYLVGLVAVKGSNHSHVAILARSMGVPTLLGVSGLPVQKLDGSTMIVDAYQSQVIVNASEAMQQHYQNALKEEQLSNKGLEQFKNLEPKTLDGDTVNLFVNTGLMTDIIQATERGAQGVGLYRSEIPFLMYERFPSEQEQLEVYREQLKIFHPKPVTMRTLDIGGDKALSYFPISEENPALGWRGIRIMLDHPEIFMVQIRAMLRANKGLGNLKILLPMISNVREFDEAFGMIERAHQELSSEDAEINMPEVGIMVEVPSIIYLLPALKSRVSFLSVGSNDLTQYLLAVDRNNTHVSKLYNFYHPAVLKACAQIAKEAEQLDIPLSICGEMAGEPMIAVLLMAMGYQNLSMSANQLLKVKALIRFVTMQQCQKLLQTALNLDNAYDIEDYLFRNLDGVSIAPLRSFSSQIS